MIYLVDGDDRKKAEQTARDFLGNNVEVIDADTLEKNDLVSIFQGTTLFEETYFDKRFELKKRFISRITKIY